MPEILQYEFMVRALIGAGMLGALAPAFGVFLILRRLSLIADTLSHVALMGVAIGLITRTYPALVALGITSVAAVSIEELRARRLLPGDAALAVFLYASLAVFVVLVGLGEGFNTNVFGYLFGMPLTTTTTDLWLLGALMIVVLVFVAVFYSELAQTSFDTDLARIKGIRVHLVNVMLALLAGATITLAMRIVGVLLVGALIVIPVLVALRLATGVRATVGLAVVTGVFTALAGMTIAFYADLAAGGAVVLTAVGVMVLAELWLLARKHMKVRRLPAG